MTPKPPATPDTVGRGPALYERAATLIPGGTQLLSKRPDLFLPGEWPAYFSSASGVEVVDLDGRTFIDVSLHGVGSCLLGYADPDVDRAVTAAIAAGTMSTLNCPEDVELAELLCALHPWADRVRYTRSGGEAMAVAVRIARAATGRDRVAVAGYHGWHDWYIGANLSGDALHDLLLPDVPAAGVPHALHDTVVSFPFGDAAAIDRLADEHGAQLAAIVVEPARYTLASGEYLRHVCAAASRIGAVVVFDEITSGFRLAVGGAHLTLGVAPDVAVFAKGMSNGYPMAAIIGRRSVMDAASRAFISSTYWTERIGPTAALATIRKLRDCNVPPHLAAMGNRMREGWQAAALRHGLDLVVRGIAPLPSFAFQYGDESIAVRTLFTQCMLDVGFLASGAFYPSYAHQPEHVDRALAATDRAFATIRTALDNDTVRAQLRGPVASTGLRPNL
jgi:glutamate-1-semialdehyde 2,1-aminomutase